MVTPIGSHSMVAYSVIMFDLWAKKLGQRCMHEDGVRLE